jgi:hypothetical protein
MKKTQTFITSDKIMSYLVQTSICINVERNAARLAQMRKIAEDEIQNAGTIQAGSDCMSLDNAIILRFKKAGIYYK